MATRRVPLRANRHSVMGTPLLMALTLLLAVQLHDAHATITPLVSPGSYDPTFACCGGCSSWKRADSTDGKLTLGSRVFIWDITLKTDPAPVCKLTFAYDPTLNEQVGDRRVRSGRLVGTTYPIDHDYDNLCCDQRGQCLLNEEDASGACHCVKRWGFVGDHCQLSIYDVAAANNSLLFPNATNLTAVKTLLPDLRSYLLSFDYESGIRSIDTSMRERSIVSSLLSVLDAGSYQQFAWISSLYFAAAAVLLMLVFLSHVLWTFCLFKCGCRRRDPTKSPKIHSQASKILWGLLMSVSLVVGAGAAMLAFIQVHTQLVPMSESILDRLWTTLVNDMTQFSTKLISPIDNMQSYGYRQSNGSRLSLSALQQRSTEAMAPHVFLEQQTRTLDVVSQPVFAVLDALQNYSLQFPTPDNSSVNCSALTITPSDRARMTIGAQTGCFQCKTCSTLAQLVANAKDVWRRNAFLVQIDLLVSKLQLEAFGASKDTLTPAIAAFENDILSGFTVIIDRTVQIAYQLNELMQAMTTVTVYGLFALLGLSGLALVLGLSGFCHGLRTNKRVMARSACFFGELAVLLALLMTGVLYTIVTMAHDGILAVELLSRTSSPFLPSDDQAAALAFQVLYDQNLVDTTGMNATLAFADTLHVPPHPEPFNDDPGRVNISSLYDLPELFSMETIIRESPQETKALNTLFQWSATFVTTEDNWLKTLAFGNASQPTPYNASIHQELLNSTVDRLLDPDNDSHILTDSDRLYVDTVFNVTWYNLSDFGVHQNQLIATQWFFVAQLYNQERKLLNYSNTVAGIINSTRPLLSDLVLLTSAMESAEFELKDPIEFFTDAIRASKINDCGYNNNCGWFRQALNELFALFRKLITQAERAVILCALSAIALLLGVCFAGCFASRLRRNIIKVYSAKIHADG